MSTPRSLVRVAAVLCFALLVTVQLQSGYASSKIATAEVNESGTIVIYNAPEPAADSLFEGIFPENGTIEGNKVAKLSPAGINSRGQVVGLCVLDGSENYPFVREPDGHFWLFKTPSQSGEGEFTDISDSGKAVGFYERNEKTRMGFLMNSQGQWVMDINYPNSCLQPGAHLHTQPNGINDKDEIVGNFQCTVKTDGRPDPLFKGDGFYRSPDGTFYRLQYENAVRTVAGKISNDGIIFGYYVLENDKWIPFAAEKSELLKPLIP